MPTSYDEFVKISEQMQSCDEIRIISKREIYLQT